uniref:beta-ketoacyl synthase N-terminal-like domain-containing protein n=1 Tax=Bradyrhizobium sp. Leaf401 TaxID=2876564 RepID=UPI001E4B98C0
MLSSDFLVSVRHPLLRCHQVLGRNYLPGMAYIDLIFQAFREHGYGFEEYELRNVCLYQPVVVNDDRNVVLHLHWDEAREGAWHIQVEGEVRHKGVGTGERMRCATAEMHHVGRAAFDQTIDLERVERDASRIVSLEDIYSKIRSQGLVHSGFMKAHGRVLAAEDAIYVDCALGAEAEESAAALMFHPALIDASAVCAGAALADLDSETRDQLFLPIVYESFCASAFLQRRCVARVRYASIERKGEVTHLTIEFFDEAGRKVAELKRLTGKRVRKAASTEAIDQTGAIGARADTDAAEFPALLSWLRQLVAARLSVSEQEIDIDSGYYELGLTSLDLMEFVRSIRAKLGVNLSPTLFFEFTTIAELATHLSGNHAISASEEVAPKVHRQELSDRRHADPAAHEVVGREIPVEPPENRAEPRSQAEDVAIVGMAGRFPQARNVREFWNNLKQGKDCIVEIPESRWDAHASGQSGHELPSGRKSSVWGGFVADADCFDPAFFRISPREAEVLDPQERLFLQTCWEAIEDAGYTPKALSQLRGKQDVGVFVGVMHKDYTLVGVEALLHGQKVPLALSNAAIANRVSYFCNFRGPSMAIDTVCSSSLTAVHLAVESIRRGECDVALAGGVNLSLHPGKYLTYGAMGMHSTDGRCRAFGEGGDGYVSGEAIAAVLLKPLGRAIADGDHVYATIKGSAINHGGKVSGITVPSPVAQADVIADCLRRFKIDPHTISYIEAHGTGTSLGDPIEIEGLSRAYGRRIEAKHFCSIGSVKSNIGHAESAAGIVGLIKVALQLRHQTLVPSLHSEKLNPYIDWEQCPFVVQRELQEWTVAANNGMPRRAALSSFGATGSNAHVILEEYQREDRDADVYDSGAPCIVPLSATNEERLQESAESLLRLLRSGQGDPENTPHIGVDDRITIRDLAYTLQVGREAMEARVCFVVQDLREFEQKLDSFVHHQAAIEGCYRAVTKSRREFVSLLASDDDVAELVNKWLRKGKINKIAELWSNGLTFDWTRLYEADARPRRISLPTYPFAR